MLAEPTYLTRDQWHAYPLPRLGHVVDIEQFVGLVVHHTVMVMGDNDADGYTNGDLDDMSWYMRRLQDGARPDLGRDVPYSFVIFEDADPDRAFVCEGRGWNRTGAHTAGYNSSRYGCALAGDYTTRSPTPGQYEAIRWIGRQLQVTAPVPTLRHGDTVATACPGNMTDVSLVQPPFTTLIPPPAEPEEEMPTYILRYAGNHDEPWLAVYPSGIVRWIGPVETNFFTDPDVAGNNVPFLDDTQYSSYLNSKLLAMAKV